MKEKKYEIDLKKVLNNTFSYLFDSFGTKLYVGDFLMMRDYIRINNYKSRLGNIHIGVVLDEYKILTDKGLLSYDYLIIDPMIDKTNRTRFYKYYKISNSIAYELLDANIDKILEYVCGITGMVSDIGATGIINIGELANIDIKKSEDDEE